MQLDAISSVRASTRPEHRPGVERFMITRRTFSVALAGLVLLVSASASAESKLKFEIYKDKGDEFRFRLKAGNGEVLATSGEGYKQKASAKNAIESLQKSPDKLTWELYEDKKSEHRFRIKAKNGNVLASSSEGYKQKADAEKAMNKVKDGAKDAEVSDETK
jgi:uncharacterized protein YegP (UPF0339 family)